MHRLADGHRVAFYGRQAHHARIQRPVRGRRLPATATDRGGAAASARRRGSRQPVAGRRVPAGRRRGTATGCSSDRPASGRRRWASERRRCSAAAQQGGRQ